jgi:hypothetical protein
MKNRFLMKIFVVALMVSIVPVRTKVRIDFFYMLLCEICLRFDKAKMLKDLGERFVVDHLKQMPIDVPENYGVRAICASYNKNRQAFENLLATDSEVQDYAEMRAKSIEVLSRRERLAEEARKEIQKICTKMQDCKQIRYNYAEQYN